MEIKAVCVLRANLLTDIWRNHQLLTMAVCVHLYHLNCDTWAALFLYSLVCTCSVVWGMGLWGGGDCTCGHACVCVCSVQPGVLWHKQTHDDAQLIICGCMLYAMSEVKARSSLGVLPAWVGAIGCI